MRIVLTFFSFLRLRHVIRASHHIYIFFKFRRRRELISFRFLFPPYFFSSFAQTWADFRRTRLVTVYSNQPLNVYYSFADTHYYYELHHYYSSTHNPGQNVYMQVEVLRLKIYKFEFLESV